jgi:hypothetical protein
VRSVAMLVDDESPVAALWTCGPEVLEVEREDWRPLAFRDGHDPSIRVSDLQIRKGDVDLSGASQQRRSEVGHCVLAGAERGQERTSRVATDAGAQELIDLDDHGLGDD